MNKYRLEDVFQNCKTILFASHPEKQMRTEKIYKTNLYNDYDMKIGMQSRLAFQRRSCSLKIAAITAGGVEHLS